MFGTVLPVSYVVIVINLLSISVGGPFDAVLPVLYVVVVINLLNIFVGGRIWCGPSGLVVCCCCLSAGHIHNRAA